MQASGGLLVAVQRSMGQGHRLARADIGEDGDDAPGSEGDERRDLVIVTGPEEEIAATLVQDARSFGRVAAGLLDAVYVRVLAEADAGLDRDVHARPAWNAVGDDGAGDGVCNREIVRKQSVLRTFVIVRRDEQKAVRAHGGCCLAEFERVGRVVGATASDDLAAAGGVADGVGDEGELLGGGERRAFAGRAADDERVDPGGELRV